jgi:hypothetical protein
MLERLMLMVNPNYRPAFLRDLNYRDRKTALCLLFANQLPPIHDEAEPVRSQGGGGGDCNVISSLSLSIVNTLRRHGDKDLMRKIVMML